MRALVTGGAGFIGSHVCEALIRLGYEVIAVDDLTTGKPANLNGLSMQFIITSSTAPKVRDLFTRGRFDLIVHLAARNIISSSTDPYGDFHTNVTETFGILDLARKSGAKVICASSCSVYGQADEFPTSESAPMRPVSYYAASKICGETYCEVFRQLHEMNITVVRYSNVYGPRQHIGVVPSMIRKTISKEQIEINGDGSHVRDYTYIDDAVEATMRLINVSNGVYNIASGVGTTTLELANTVSKVCEAPLNVQHVNERSIDNISHRVLSCTALEKTTNFKCQTNLSEGLTRTVEWWRSENSLAY